MNSNFDSIGFTDTTVRNLVTKTVPITVVDGAAAGTFTLPTGAVVSSIHEETPTAIPGTPTTTNLRIGSAAAGQQYVADVDVKAQGYIALTALYAARNATGTFHYTVTSTGGTAASQDGTIYLHVSFLQAAG